MTRSHNSTRGGVPMKVMRAVRNPRWNSAYRTPAWKDRISYDEDDINLAYDLDPLSDEDEAAEDEMMMPLSLIDDLAAVALHRDSSEGSSEWTAVTHSEWDAVTAAESEWLTVHDEPIDAAAVWTLADDDDAQLARSLWQAETDLFMPSAKKAGKQPQLPTQPAIAETTLAQLRQSCGLCVVCMESIALIAWEPCGHLALCERCHDQIPGWQRDSCVVCRTEGTPTKLFSPPKTPPDVYGVYGLNISSTSGTLETSSSVNCNRDHAKELMENRLSKLEWRRAKRTLTRLKRSHLRGGILPCYRSRYYNNGHFHRPFPSLIASSRLSVYELAEACERYHPSKAVGCAYFKGELTKRRSTEKKSLREALQLAKEQERDEHAWLADVAKEAEERSRTLGGACRQCGEKDACMLAIRCGHVTMCRECWLAPKDEAEARCLECGGSCKLSMQLYKPMAMPCCA